MLYFVSLVQISSYTFVVGLQHHQHQFLSHLCDALHIHVSPYNTLQQSFSTFQYKPRAGFRGYKNAASPFLG